MTTLRWGSATDRGMIRRNNQDNLLARPGLVAVADGMGGHVGGEVASEIAVVALDSAFATHDEPRTAEGLIDAVRAANQAVYDRAQNQPDLRGMGTTLTAAALIVHDDEERLAVANVGDSRTYLFTQQELTQLTEDHSVAEELVRRGQLDPSEVDTHPQRHILTRAMGILPDVDVDLWELLPLVGDRLLLCSDGLVREITDDQIASVLRRLADPAEAAQELVARARDAGGSDNITVVILDIVDDDDPPRASVTVRPDVASGSGEIAPDVGRTTVAAPRVDPPNDIRRAHAEDGGERDLHAATLPKRRRRITLRVVLFVVLMLVVVGGAGGAVLYYARGSYYVGLGPGGPVVSPLDVTNAQRIVIFQGRPGGLLWFSPTVAQQTGTTTAEVCPAQLAELTRGKIESSTAAARAYVQNLVQEAARTCPGGAVTPLSTTTTTPPANRPFVGTTSTTRP